MPLFTMPKKSVLNEVSNNNDKILNEEIKTQEKVDCKLIKEDYAILGCNTLKFFYIYYTDNRKPLNYTQYSYLPDNDILENKILSEAFSLKNLLIHLRRVNKKSIIIYSDIPNLDLIIEWSNIRDMGSMFRYKAREILKELEEYPIDITFRSVEENDEIKEVRDNEVKLQGN